MTDPRKISISNFTYDLPDDRIARFPLEKRDASKLLVYRKGQTDQDVFSNIASYLPEESLLVFNNTKVINARLRFQKSTGAVIEVFCLEPAGNVTEYSSVMNTRGTCTWKCFIGGVSKWKEPVIERQVQWGNTTFSIRARIIEKTGDAYLIEFSWEPATLSFAEILESAGDIPLPPYINRTTSTGDFERYQTIYARYEGSVAAPTAGLHFTESIFKSFEEKNIEKEYLTLHVGAGTFKPVKASTMQDHEMHAEWIDVSVSTIKKLSEHTGLVVAVGTTSLRTIETLYWLGVKLMNDPAINQLELGQWDVYSPHLEKTTVSKKIALQSLMKWLEDRKLDHVFTQTQLMIVPGYNFRVAGALVTNFHQPKSTLLLLVAAAVGNHWRELYNYALEKDFRFLSYGDGNLIFMAGS
jgi:S-adenosylmethionine:tRNA ribosyltransferase-isomerase